MSVCLSVRLSSWKNSSPSGRIFMKFDIQYISKICWEIQVPLKSDKYDGCFTWRPMYIFDHIWFGSSCTEKRLRLKLQRKSKLNFIFNIFFRKSCRLWDNVERYCRAGQATDDNMTHAHCMLVIKGYKHILRICNTYCFTSATMVTRTRLNVILYVTCLSCF